MLCTLQSLKSRFGPGPPSVHSGVVSAPTALAAAHFLIVIGADPNAPLLGEPYWALAAFGVIKGMRPLHIAVLSQEWEIVELLLQYGADPEGTDGRGKKAEEYLPANLRGKLKVLEKKAR